MSYTRTHRRETPRPSSLLVGHHRSLSSPSPWLDLASRLLARVGQSAMQHASCALASSSVHLKSLFLPPSYQTISYEQPPCPPAITPNPSALAHLPTTYPAPPIPRQPAQNGVVGIVLDVGNVALVTFVAMRARAPWSVGRGTYCRATEKRRCMMIWIFSSWDIADRKRRVGGRRRRKRESSERPTDQRRCHEELEADILS